MARKLACIIYLNRQAGLVQATRSRLLNAGFEINVFEVDQAQAEAVVRGDSSSLPGDLRECLETADLCVLLFGEGADCLSVIGELGSDLGCRVVTVGGNPEALPEQLDDVIDGHITDIDQPYADEVLGGDRRRIKGDGEPAEARKAKRQKCQ